MPAPRRHRLPQRLDWHLVPPPLDLSKPLVDEKAALPAIIVTPSSPTCDRDFAIAFLADQSPKAEAQLSDGHQSSPTALLHSALKRAPRHFRPRMYLLAFIALFLLLCHALAHGIAARRPRLHFIQPASSIQPDGNGWFDLNDYRRARAADEFVVESDSDSNTEPSLDHVISSAAKFGMRGL